MRPCDMTRLIETFQDAVLKLQRCDYKEAGGEGKGGKERKLGFPFHHAIVPAFVVLMMPIVQKLKLKSDVCGEEKDSE